MTPNSEDERIFQEQLKNDWIVHNQQLLNEDYVTWVNTHSEQNGYDPDQFAQQYPPEYFYNMQFNIF